METHQRATQHALYSPLHGWRKQGRQRLLYPLYMYIERLVSPDFLLSPLEIRRIAQDRGEACVRLLCSRLMMNAVCTMTLIVNRITAFSQRTPVNSE